MGASVGTDAAGNANAAATDFTYTYDSASPSTTITSSADDPTNGATIEVTITFGQSVTGLVVSEVVVSGGSVALSGSGATYTATITPTADGTITVNVAAGVASDAAGNGNTIASEFSIVSDQNDAPSITSTAVATGTEDTA